MTSGSTSKQHAYRVPIRDVLLGLFVFHVIAPRLALAYLDPITGSIVLQVLAAGFLAAAATFRKSREWLAGIFQRLMRGRGS